MASNSTATASFPLLPILFLVFLVLKLTGVIAWSWWLVTAPLWGGLLLALLIFAAILAVVAKRR